MVPSVAPVPNQRASNGRFLPGTHWRPHAQFREREYLVREYVDGGRSAPEIAVEHGVHENAILYWLTKHGITRRTIAQARAVKPWGPAGDRNPMFGRCGPLNPRYVDGSSPERQSLYAKSEWKSLVVAIYTRDRFTCARCGNPRASDRKLVAHHIRPWAGNPSLRRDPENLITMCAPCHRWIHSNANTNREWLA